MTEEESLEMTRSNYAAQLRAMGYDAGGNPLGEKEFKAAHTDMWHWYCGKCGSRIPLKIKAHYCHKCGSKIDWSERTRLKQEALYKRGQDNG